MVNQLNFSQFWEPWLYTKSRSLIFWKTWLWTLRTALIIIKVMFLFLRAVLSLCSKPPISSPFILEIKGLPIQFSSFENFQKLRTLFQFLDMFRISKILQLQVSENFQRTNSSCERIGRLKYVLLIEFYNFLTTSI